MQARNPFPLKKCSLQQQRDLIFWIPSRRPSAGASIVFLSRCLISLHSDHSLLVRSERPLAYGSVCLKEPVRL